MIQFRETQPDGCRLGVQTTKTDLVDIARALELPARDDMTCDAVRALLATKLAAFVPKSSRQATKADLLGIAKALGLDVKSRPHATGKNMPVEGLRAWIRTYLLERVPVPGVIGEPVRQFHAGELVQTPKGPGVVIEQGARVEVRIVDSPLGSPLEYFWPIQLR